MMRSGWLPKMGTKMPQKPTTMVGDPAGNLVIEKYLLKGIRDFDVEKAYSAMVNKCRSD